MNSTTQKSLLALLLFFFTQMLHAQHISCFDADVLKDKSTITIPSVSDFTLPNDGLIGCFSDTLHQAYWFKFTALTSGTFKFAASANNLGADYDFVLFSEACPCDTMASKIAACNWFGAVLQPPFLPTGIADKPSDFGITDPMAQLEFEPTISLQAGKNYYLILDNISNNGVGFKLEFGGTATIGAPAKDPIPQLGNILGKKDICSGTSNIYEVTTDPRFTDYTWILPSDAKLIGKGSKVQITFGKIGGKIAVIAKNSCIADTAFLDIKVNVAPDLQLSTPAVFCKNNCLPTNDIIYKEKNNLPIVDYKFYNKKDDAYLGTLKNLSNPVICQSQPIWLRGTSPEGCFDTLAINITEIANPSVVLFGGGTACLGDTVYLSFSFTGKPPFGVIYSDGTKDYTFMTNQGIINKRAIINQTTKFFIKNFIEASNACSLKMIGEAEYFVSPNCKCLKKAGTMQTLPIEVCANFDAIGIHNQDDVKDTNDKLTYILHSVKTPELATVFGMSDTPTFSFMSGLMYNTPYYISSVVGKKKSNGEIDLSDPCLGVSPGVEVMFLRPPSATLEADTVICANDITDITITPKGTSPFIITYGNSFYTDILNTDKPISFKESVGTFFIKKIIDASGCKSTFTDTISIKAPKKMEIGAISYLCNAANTDYQVSFEIINGVKNTYKSLDGKGTWAGNIFTSQSIPNGQLFSIKITDSNGCDTLVISDKHICSCGTVSIPATLNLPALVVCESLSATASYTPDEKLVLGDTQGYILHDGDTKKIGNVLIFNTLPQFSKQNGIVIGKTYYIISVAGSKDATGKIDIKSPCTQFGKTTVPITFVEEPTLSISGVSEVCANESIDIDFTFTGTAPFDIVYNDGKKDISILNISDLSHPVMLSSKEKITYKLISVKSTGTPGCKGTINALKSYLTVDVSQPLEAKNIKVNCSPDKKNYNVSFEIEGGIANTYEVNATPVNGNLFYSETFADGQNYDFKIESKSNCKPLFVNGTGFCTCPPGANLSLNIVKNLKCNNDKNAILKTDVKNLNLPLTYQWSNGATTEILENISAGMYVVTVQNNSNCRMIDSVEVKNPEVLRSTIEVKDARCYNEPSGEIKFVATSGGMPPYLYSIDNQSFRKENVFPKIKNARYEVLVKDANSCIWNDLVMVDSPEDFKVSLGENQIVPLGQSTQIEALISDEYDKITWSDGGNEKVKNLLPLQSQEYKITVVNKNACEAKGSVWIYVKAEREVFAPSSFSPNNDGYNDSFTIFAGPDVAKIKSLQVFDRWGNEVFNEIDLSANDESKGWQGTFRGLIANQDHYIYAAKVEFIDGKVKDFSGEVLLMR
jgi:gliding motility-associated-like protein